MPASACVPESFVYTGIHRFGVLTIMIRTLLAAAICAWIVGGCAVFGPQVPPPTVAEIVEMAKKGTPAEEIIERIRQSRGIYRLQASELADLREQGVPDKVIDTMQQTYIDDVRFEAEMRARSYGWPPWPYYRHPWSRHGIMGPSHPYWW